MKSLVYCSIWTVLTSATKKSAPAQHFAEPGRIETIQILCNGDDVGTMLMRDAPRQLLLEACFMLLGTERARRTPLRCGHKHGECAAVAQLHAAPGGGGALVAHRFHFVVGFDGGADLQFEQASIGQSRLIVRYRERGGAVDRKRHIRSQRNAERQAHLCG